MKIGWGVVAGLGVAGLLVAGAPANAKTDDKTHGSSGSASSQTTTDPSTTSPGATGTTGSSSTMGSPSGSSGTSSDPAGSMPSERHAAAMGSTNEVTGKVEKFDQASKELTLSLKVSDSTQVTKDGQTASLSDIKEGDQVRASFSGTGESLQVTQIEVMSKGAAEPTEPKSKSKSKSTEPGGTTGSTSPTEPGSTGSSTSGSSSGRGY